jgi:hypothetical protein
MRSLPSIQRSMFFGFYGGFTKKISSQMSSVSDQEFLNTI